jgi:phosphoribosylglycinamide formyltransferase-1
MNKRKAAILISGRGSNMRALVAAARDADYPAEIALVLSNRPDAAGIAWAREQGVTAKVVDHTAYASREAFDAAVNQALVEQAIELVACAGFMRIMTPLLIEGWRDRMLNIHPSLLPAYRGLHTHERALADGVRIHGCTVHLVRQEVDTGPILAQAAVPVIPGDTPETLADRVLAAEHAIYPVALARLAAGRDWSGTDAPGALFVPPPMDARVRAELTRR